MLRTLQDCPVTDADDDYERAVNEDKRPAAAAAAARALPAPPAAPAPAPAPAPTAAKKMTKTTPRVTRLTSTASSTSSSSSDGVQKGFTDVRIQHTTKVEPLQLPQSRSSTTPSPRPSRQLVSILQ